jgi:hypothetical protein
MDSQACLSVNHLPRLDSSLLRAECGLPVKENSPLSNS